MAPEQRSQRSATRRFQTTLRMNTHHTRPSAGAVSPHRLSSQALSRKSREFSSYRERRRFEGQSTSLGVSEAKARFDRPAIAFGPSFEGTRPSLCSSSETRKLVAFLALARIQLEESDEQYVPAPSFPAPTIAS